MEGNPEKCPLCGKNVPQEALYCPWCGYKLTVEKEKPVHAPKRRGNGQGTVYKRGSSYIAVKTIGYYIDDSGKKHRRTVSKTFSKKKDAVLSLSTLDSPQNMKKAEKSTATLKDVYDKWITTLTSTKDTQNCYKAAWKYFSPVHALFSHEIDVDDLQECINDCPRGKRTQQNMKTCIGLIYKYGIPRGYFPEKLNLAQYLKTGGETGSGGVGLPDIYVEKILKASNTVPGADLITAQCYLGFRPSEFLSLTHDSYDSKTKTFCGGAKTEAGKNRIVTVSPKIQRIIDKYASKNGDQFFTAPDGNKMDIRVYRDLFYSVLDALSLENPIIKVGDIERHKYTPHSCRHVFANFMKRATGSDKDKQSLIGHSSSEMLRYYQDATLEDLRKITDQF